MLLCYREVLGNCPGRQQSLSFLQFWNLLALYFLFIQIIFIIGFDFFLKSYCIQCSWALQLLAHQTEVGEKEKKIKKRVLWTCLEVAPWGYSTRCCKKCQYSSQIANIKHESVDVTQSSRNHKTARLACVSRRSQNNKKQNLLVFILFQHGLMYLAWQKFKVVLFDYCLI